jgi:hypothetical protein
MSDGPRYPLSWRQKRTPTRRQRRSKRWIKLYIGMRFEGTCWVLVEGPWKRLKRHGSQAWVRVLCSEKHGGCGTEHERKLSNIMQGSSKGCAGCRDQRLRRRREQAG